MKSLTDELQAIIDPICDRYSVPREEMRLSFTQTGDSAGIHIGAKELLGFNVLGAMVGTVISVVFALLCGGGGIALIATGPLGMVAGAAIGALFSALGWPAVTEALMAAKFPRALRLVNVERRLRGESAKRGIRDALTREINKPDSAFASGVVKGFTDSFQRYLRQIAASAEIPIQ